MSDKRIRRRVEICSRCRYVGVRRKGGVAGSSTAAVAAVVAASCSIAPATKKNRHWSSKHPDGSRWKEAGI